MNDRSPSLPQLGLLLRLLHQQWALAIEAALAEAGFGNTGAAHGNVFLFVPPEGIQVSELAKRARVRKQTMAQTVEELEKLGYVERHPDPRDRRGRLVFLTERGRRVRPVAAAAGRTVEQRWAARTSRKEIDALRQALQSLLDRVG